MSSGKFEKYGMEWPEGTRPLKIEFWAIQQGKAWCESQGRSLFYHYREAQSLLWPDDEHHRWSDLSLKRFTEETITIMLGCGGSGKSYGMARFALTDWWAFADKTLWLVSSTEYRGADLRIWGDIQLLFNRALKLNPWLPGKPLLSLHAITYDDETDDEEDYFKAARSLKRGMIVVPNKKGNVSVGLSAFVGVRVPRLRHAGSEVQFMTAGFLDAYTNWYGNSDFKGIMDGNPMDITDQLCTAAEPAGGWDSFVDTEKTQEWRCRFYDAWAIAFDGRDTPNNDFPDALNNPRYSYLIKPSKLKAVEATHGKNGWQWFSQCVGKPNKGLLLWRVVTSQMCQKNGAFDACVWKGTKIVSIYALDPAYGGGDRCMGGRIEFGQDVDGVYVIKVYPPENFPINLRLELAPEEQIARHLKKRLTEYGIPPENCFYDSFGKGTLGHYFAQVFGSSTPIPIDSGAVPTDRPVRFDLFVLDGNGKRRLKTCREHYSKFVSEMWFSCAEAIQSGQIRELPKDVAAEGYIRTYRMVKGNRHEVESKEQMKERMQSNKSPDLFDWFAISVEGARQRGFRIERIGKSIEVETDRFAWYKQMLRLRESQKPKTELNYSA